VTRRCCGGQALQGRSQDIATRQVHREGEARKDAATIRSASDSAADAAAARLDGRRLGDKAGSGDKGGSGG